MPDHTIQLKNGRRISYHVNESDDGLPLFVFHGWGGSRLTSHPDRSIAEALRIRLVTIDRPGIGLSDPSPGRAILDWPDDISALADHLGIDRFAVLGHSAGAPYALACTRRLPDRILSATIVSGIGPCSSGAQRLFALDSRTVAFPFRRAPALVRLLFRIGRLVLVSPTVVYMYRTFNRPFATDRGVMGDPEMKDMRIRSLREAFRQGIDGIYVDAILVLQDWGFSLVEIKSPVRIWHGESDAIVDVAFGRQLYRELPCSVSTFDPKSGHHMIYVHWREILENVKEDSMGANWSLGLPRDRLQRPPDP